MVRPRSLPATAPVTPVIFPALAVTPAFPPWVPGSNSAQYRALSRFKFPSPTPLLPKSTDQLSPASPIPCLHSPKQRHFLPGPKTFSSLGNAIRQETRSAATSTRFAQRPVASTVFYLAAALQVTVPRRPPAPPRLTGVAGSPVL